MGEHKIPGASKGPGYKTDQCGSSVAARRIEPHTWKPGTIYKTYDGCQYQVQKNGSIKRIS